MLILSPSNAGSAIKQSTGSDILTTIQSYKKSIGGIKFSGITYKNKRVYIHLPFILILMYSCNTYI